MKRFLRTLLAGTLMAAPTLAQAQAAASLCDEAALTTDATFQNRVRQALIGACLTVPNEAVTLTGSSGVSIQLHLKRVQLCTQILDEPDNFKTIFAAAVATDANVGSDATLAGPLCGATAATIATQAASVTDAHITAAIGSAANAFFSFP